MSRRTSPSLRPPVAKSVNVTYTNLPINRSVLAQSNLNAVNVSIKVTDNWVALIPATRMFMILSAPPISRFEMEDFDFNGGMFIDNPVMSFVGPDTNTYFMEQTPYVNLVDVNENGNTAGPLRVYRDPTYPVETEFSIGGGGNNGGNSIGELMRQKVLDACSHHQYRPRE